MYVWINQNNEEDLMKTTKKLIAAFLAMVMAVALFSNTAFAASRQSISDRNVALAKRTVENLDTDQLYNGDVNDPILVYYASQPFTYPFALMKWGLDNKKQKRADYEGNMQDLSVGVVSSLAGYFGKNYVSKTLSTLKDASSDISDGLKNGPDELVGKASKKAPIVSDIYELTGPVGKMTLQAILLPGYLATNAGALAFVLVGGGVALLVIFGLSGVLSPLLAYKEGPRTIDQFFRDLHEMEVAVDKA